MTVTWLARADTSKWSAREIWPKPTTAKSGMKVDPMFAAIATFFGDPVEAKERNRGRKRAGCNHTGLHITNLVAVKTCPESPMPLH